MQISTDFLGWRPSLRVPGAWADWAGGAAWPPGRKRLATLPGAGQGAGQRQGAGRRQGLATYT